MSPVLQVQDNEDIIQSQDILHIKQQLFDSNESMDNIPESPIEDTGKPSEDQKVLTNVLQTNINLDVNLLQDPLQIEDPQDFPDKDTILLNSDALNDESYSTVIEAIPDCPMIQVDKPVTDPVTMHQASILAEKVVCIFLTECLQKYLDEYSQLADNKAFLDIHHMLTLLDHHLSQNLAKHSHCMSYNTEYVTLLNQAI